MRETRFEDAAPWLDDCEVVIEKLYLQELEKMAIEQAMSDEFVRNNTPFPDFEELVIAAGCEPKSSVDFDGFLRTHTKFKNWKEMFEAAVKYLSELEEAAEPVH